MSTDKRRTCADRARADLMMRKIHRRKRIDPAMSVAIQMLGLFSALIRMFPELPDRSPFALPSPPPVVPVLPLGPPPERPIRYKNTPSWSLLMKDLARPVARGAALAEIRSRLPLGVHPWLAEVERLEDWSALRICAPPGSKDTAVVLAVGRSAQEWQAELDERARAAKADRKKGGGGDASSGAVPGAGPDSDDDPGRGMKR